MSATTNEIQLTYLSSFDLDGSLITKLESASSNGNIILETERKFNTRNPDYKMLMARWLEEYAFELHTTVSIENSTRIVDGLQDIISRVYYEKGPATFRDERFGGLHYLKAVFGSISRSDIISSNQRSTDMPPVGEITPYPGYITGLTPFYAQEEMLLFMFPFRNWLDSTPTRLTPQDVVKIKNELPTAGYITYWTYFWEIATIFLDGTDCGCCGNYQGQCYYAHPLCAVHDWLCESCSPELFCFSGCVPTPC